MEVAMTESVERAENPTEEIGACDADVFSSANWAVASGSLRESVTYDCSSYLMTATDSLGSEEGSAGLLLLQPSSEDSVSEPCEITISFREKHHIHQVYVRSTARVYEIYYASEKANTNNEYLYTVRCGMSTTKVMLPEINVGQISIKGLGDSYQNLPETSNASDDDGWVEVKNSSFLRNDDSNEVCYEATAEISDASPCISLTIRLLSIQSKGCIYIDEIYIYADPVEPEATGSCSPISSGNKLSGSLLAMLVPGLVKLSKDGHSRASDEIISDGYEKHSFEDLAIKSIEKGSPTTSMGICMEAHGTTVDSSSGNEQDASEIKRVDNVPSLCQGMLSVSPEEKIAPSINVEKILDDLISRVDRIETLCLKFEENRTKPLLSIEAKLQKMEQQLSRLAIGTHCPVSFSSSRIDQELLDNVSDLGDEDCLVSNDPCRGAASDNPSREVNNLTSHQFGTKTSSGLMISAPDFQEKFDSDSSYDNLNEVKHCSLDKAQYLCDDDCNSNKGSNKTQKNLIEDEACILPEIRKEDGSSGSTDATTATKKEDSQEKVPLTIETALTSALHAFLISSRSKAFNFPCEGSENLVEVDMNNQIAGSLAGLDHGEGSHSHSGIQYSGSTEHSEPGFSSHVSFLIGGKGGVDQVHCCLNQTNVNETDLRNNSRILAESFCCLPCGPESSEINDAREVAPHNSNKSLSDIDFENDSTNSTIEDCKILDNCPMDWSDKSSTSSIDDTFAFQKWLSEKQKCFRSSEEDVKETLDDDHITNTVKVSACPDYEKSIKLLEHALNSAQEQGNIESTHDDFVQRNLITNPVNHMFCISDFIPCANFVEDSAEHDFWRSELLIQQELATSKDCGQIVTSENYKLGDTWERPFLSEEVPMKACRNYSDYILDEHASSKESLNRSTDRPLMDVEGFSAISTTVNIGKENQVSPDWISGVSYSDFQQGGLLLEVLGRTHGSSNCCISQPGSDMDPPIDCSVVDVEVSSATSTAVHTEKVPPISSDCSSQMPLFSLI